MSTLPYLHSVKSPEGEGSVPNYYSVRELPAAEFQRGRFWRLTRRPPLPGRRKPGIAGRTENASGRVETVTIGGVTVEGTEVRSLYGLRSALLHCGGRGGQGDVSRHRLRPRCGRLSQYGANQLAAEGKTWQDILHWYYTDVTIGPYG
ncbi:MAG: hypothetical protein ACLU38_05260 [Dysosmobacter sp.]